MFNTIALVVVTVPLCVVIGVAVAWLVERTDLPGRAVWRPIFVAPLAIPAFVNSYAWVGVIPSLHGLWAGVLVTTLSYFPFMYLPVAATLRRLDPAIEESARALGSDSAGVFFRVVLPQLRLAILGGGLLIGVHLLAEFGAFALLSYPTLTTGIYGKWVRLNVIHDVNAQKMTIYVNGSSAGTWSSSVNKDYYFKYGIYGTLNTPTAQTEWRNVRFYRK